MISWSKFKQWYVEKYHVDIDVHFEDNQYFALIETHVFPRESNDAVPFDFGSFTWKPDIAVKFEKAVSIEEAITYIENQFEKVTGFTLWTEVDIVNKIRRVLQKGKTDTIVIPWGAFKRYRLNIRFSREVEDGNHH